MLVKCLECAGPSQVELLCCLHGAVLEGCVCPSSRGTPLQALESHVGISLQAPESLNSIFLFSKDSATHKG